jgi:hypothetical protein
MSVFCIPLLPLLPTSVLAIAFYFLSNTDMHVGVLHSSLAFIVLFADWTDKSVGDCFLFFVKRRHACRCFAIINLRNHELTKFLSLTNQCWFQIEDES